MVCRLTAQKVRSRPLLWRHLRAIKHVERGQRVSVSALASIHSRVLGFVSCARAAVKVGPESERFGN